MCFNLSIYYFSTIYIITAAGIKQNIKKKDEISVFLNS